MLEWIIEKIRLIICLLIFKNHWYKLIDEDEDCFYYKCRVCGSENVKWKEGHSDGFYGN